MITFIEWLLENTEPQSFTLSDKNIVPEWVYNIFVESYLKSTGKAWDMNTFLGRSRSWTFFGIPPESEHDPAAEDKAFNFTKIPFTKELCFN